MKFPEILETGVLPKEWSVKSLVADGLCGWATCEMGKKPPEKFGEGMALISSIVGTATPEGLSKLADKLLTEK